MLNKEKYGIYLMLFLSIIPVLIWIFYMPLLPRISDYGEIVHSLGQLSGLIGLTLMSFTFILATRLKFLENYFGPLDKVYGLHALIGGMPSWIIKYFETQSNSINAKSKKKT